MDWELAEPEGQEGRVVQEAQAVLVGPEMEAKAALRGRTGKEAEKAGKVTVEEAADPEAAGLAVEAALVGGLTVQAGVRMARTTPPTGQPCSRGWLLCWIGTGEITESEGSMKEKRGSGRCGLSRRFDQ